MPLISATDAPVFELHGATFTGLASPSRGATENAVWIVTVRPGTPAVLHRLTREETFVGIEGEARAIVAGQLLHVTPGSALVVPPHTDFALENPFDAPFRAVVVLPVGGQGLIGDGPAFTPPWAE
jgi:mannose-6-phosphate isomerase-like protein (cupin superfamily)